MTFSTSYIPASTIRDTMNATIAPKWGPTSGGDTLHIALFSSSMPGGIMTDDPAHYNVGSYSSSSYEVYGTGWSAGGVALTSVAVDTVNSAGTEGTSAATATSSAGVGINFTAGNVSQTGTTLVSAYGCAIWDYTISSTVGPVICAVTFGGAFSTASGTFAVTWAVPSGWGSTTSIFYVTL